MLSKPETPPTAGRTNASNPTSLGELQKAADKIKDLGNQPFARDPSKPHKNLPILKSNYQVMGDAIGVNPYEIQAIMQHEFNPNNELVVSILKKFISAVKLSGEVDLAPLRNSLREIEETHERNMDAWHKQVAYIEKTNDKLEQEIVKANEDFYAAWSKIVVDLIMKIQTNDDINSLGAWDQFMVRALAQTDPLLAAVNNDRITISFEACKKMTVEKIQGIPHMAAALQKDARERDYLDWLLNAREADIQNALLGCTSSGEMELLRSALFARKGLRPVYDKYTKRKEWVTEKELMDHVTVSYDEGDPWNVISKKIRQKRTWNIMAVSYEDVVYDAFKEYLDQLDTPF